MKLHVKRKPTLIPSNTMTSSELIQLYQNWNVYDSKQSIRDKIVLGLFVFQAIHSYELKYLTISDINFDKMLIIIKQNNRSNERNISIDINQLIDLKNFVDNIRHQFNNNSDLLIVTDREKNSIQSILGIISKKLTKKNTSFSLIRTSRIKHWITLYNLRQVQYLCGHKYISSTERYITTDIESLKKSVIKHHPFE